MNFLTKTLVHKRFLSYTRRIENFRLQRRAFSSSHNVPSTETIFQKFIQKTRKLILKRIVLFRVLFYGSVCLIVYTTIRYMNNTNYAQYTTPVFFLQNKADQHAIYNVAGVIKPGTVEFIKGSDEMCFILTDFEHEIKIFYKGPLPNNFTEGGTAIATGTITDKDRPNILVSNKLMTNHSYNEQKWKMRSLKRTTIKDEDMREDLTSRIEAFTKMK